MIKKLTLIWPSKPRQCLVNSLSERPRADKVCLFIDSAGVGPCWDQCTLDKVAPPDATYDVASGAVTVRPVAWAIDVADLPGYVE